MIDFNKLLVLPNQEGLYIDVSVMDAPYFDTVYIDKIVIDTQSTYTSTGISTTPVYQYTVPGSSKSVKLTIKAEDILTPMVGSMFFIYVQTKGTPTSDTPCGLDQNPQVGICVDLQEVYRKAMKYIGVCADSCSVPREFIDFILQYRAFTTCIQTKDFQQAIIYWNRFWKNLKKTPINCNCYGRDTI